ncbi:hypothetical protein [Pleomorphovibrio marinus]|uniref:hypothetical protein n=1 Tax=Pleomorphovibrio marinus TaxID=2164132 RepID=UPI000E0B6A69|nr:hypothetical protein [Pleomorphovibrio marinus]
MTIEEFKASLASEKIPEQLSVHLRSLWYDAKGDWDKAHSLIDSLLDKDSAYLHAYLHRKEGDMGNAGYWYNKAGRVISSKTLDEEWEELLRYFLERES